VKYCGQVAIEVVVNKKNKLGTAVLQTEKPSEVNSRIIGPLICSCFVNVPFGSLYNNVNESLGITVQWLLNIIHTCRAWKIHYA